MALVHPDELIKELSGKLNENHITAKDATLLCNDLITAIYRQETTIRLKDAEQLLNSIRSRRYFTAMQSVADALIQTGHDSFRIRRLYGQSQLDLSNITAALSILDQLQADTKAAGTEDGDDEYKEATGLKGRAYKQLYQSSGRPQFLIKAIDAYAEIYRMGAEENLWHSVNLMTLLKRAAKDGIDVSAYDNADDIANMIIKVIERLYKKEHAGMWDYATAMEASIALDKPDEALRWLSCYTRMADANAFALSATLRQLEEVWKLDMDSKMGTLMLPVLRAELLKREGGNVMIHVDELLLQKKAEAESTEKYRSLADENIEDGKSRGPELERVFGDDSFKTYKWYMTGADRCLAVARIGRDESQGHGTGFLLRGSLLHESLGDELVVVTNAHVVSNDPKENALRPEEAVIIFEALDRDAIFPVSELIFTSSSRELDVSVIRFNAEDQARLKELTKDVNIYKVASLLPRLNVGDKQLQRIYIIGHPGGGTLQLSFQDNTLLDHQDPKIHYRTPTEGGSSGSPVFNESWELIGLHHAGSKTLPKLNGKQGTYEGNEGIWIAAIKKAISAVL